MFCDINKMSSKSKLFFRIAIIFLCILFHLVLIASVSLEIISYFQLSLFHSVIITVYLISGKLRKRFFTKKTESFIAKSYIIVFVVLFSLNILVDFINPTVYASDSVFSIENLLNEDEVFNYTDINDSRSDLFKEKTCFLQNADVKFEDSNEEYEIELSTYTYVFRIPFLSNVYMKTIVPSKDKNDLNNIITEQKGDSYFCCIKQENTVYVIECNEKWLLERITEQVTANQGTVSVKT